MILWGIVLREFGMGGRLIGGVFEVMNV